ncbi:ovalbumin-like [Lucilia sericata]|uniref:ovalbumin-like n=1 Tax=Lucilia sericata TaxID=13632 RepID=UPI0018A7FF0C|nr:ovalbumin-like [Lucilia sericata]
MVKILRTDAQTAFKFLMLTLLLTLRPQVRADIFNLENFGQTLFIQLTESHQQENQLLAPLPIAGLLILLRNSAEPYAAYEIGEYLEVIAKDADEITSDFLQRIDKFNSKQFFVMKSIILIQAEPNEQQEIYLDRGTVVKDRYKVNICRDAAIFRRGHQEIPELVLTTEIQFKGIFHYAFLSTEKKPFLTSDSTMIEKEMLTLQANLRFADILELSLKAFEIPYSNDKDSLVILSPNSQQGLEYLEAILKEFPLSGIEPYLQPRYIKLQFPKGEIVVEKSLKEGLQFLGINGIFENLCGMESDIRVSDIIFKGSFAIEENNVGISSQDDMGSPEEFVIDHPFIFMVKGSASEPYLIGKFAK